MAVNNYWKKRTELTKEAEQQVKDMLQTWLGVNPEWVGLVMFVDFPPRLEGKLEILHLNSLSDKRLEEVGTFTTKVCETLKMTGNTRKISGAAVLFKFWIPDGIKE